MSDDNLETLDNASLRKKCQEFGLPNVPITDTSRQVLIRKLRAAMTGKPADKKNRRETIHVTKILSPVEDAANVVVEEPPKRPPSRIQRRTIAATSVTSTVDDTTLNKAAPVSDRRRSVRSQVEQEVPVSIPVSQKRKTETVLLEEEDEDGEDDVILLKGERDIVIPRLRRSVSLSKTGVVTTSYRHETAGPPIINETESESENDLAVKYVSGYEPLPRPLTSVATGQQPRNTLYGLSDRKVVVEPERTASFPMTTVNRTSIEPEPLYKPPSPPPISRYSYLGSGYSAKNESSTTTTTTRRFTTGGYGAAPAAATKYTSVYDNEEEVEDDGEGEAPYLSDFARRLERIKAEPLVKTVESPRNIPIKRESQRYQSSIVGRRSTTQKDSVTESFKNFIFVLDRKYKLKRNFAILFAVILLLFIYIVLIR